eukprot:Protomagalhaensia_wolfi_Nauph_80__156@NODE_1089_length_1743_cov_60_623826_g831_i0_p1_GENE_NODE_1089_length_1743_cov_60_623826_g831_i0NODE_1089_length_1743_cov_60_623826_g831_i0_p1_ORF_typecomplete_len390_score92_75_NODE_1089_length_1743_cov_60_623826_g831_i0661235
MRWSGLWGLLVCGQAQNPSVQDITSRFPKEQLDLGLLQPALVVTDGDLDPPNVVILESKLPPQNVTFVRKKERWNPSLVEGLTIFEVPPEGKTFVYQLRFRLDESAAGRLATGISNTQTTGPEMALTGCFLTPSGDLISVSLGAARFGFTPQLVGGDVVDWMMEVHPDVTMDVWLMVNGIPQGRAFALDFDQDSAALESLRPAVAFTGHSHGDRALLAVFPPVPLDEERLAEQAYRKPGIHAVIPEQPWLGNWEIAVSDVPIFQQAKEDNVELKFTLRAGPTEKDLILNCRVANSMSTALIINAEQLPDDEEDRWVFQVMAHGPSVTTLMLPPPSLQPYETACLNLLETVRIIGYHSDVIGLYFDEGQVALTRALYDLQPFTDATLIDQ